MFLMAVTEVPYSTFLRSPTEVLPALEHGDVQLDRRDAEALVMTRARRYRSRLEGTEFSARVIGHVARPTPDLGGGVGRRTPLAPLVAFPGAVGVPVGHHHRAGCRRRDGDLRTLRTFSYRMAPHGRGLG